MGLEVLEGCQVGAAQERGVDADSTSCSKFVGLGRAASNSSLVELASFGGVGAGFEAPLGFQSKSIPLLDVTSDLSARVAFTWVSNYRADNRSSCKSGNEIADADHGYS